MFAPLLVLLSTAKARSINGTAITAKGRRISKKLGNTEVSSKAPGSV